MATAAAPSKNNEIKQTSTNIRLTQLVQLIGLVYAVIVTVVIGDRDAVSGGHDIYCISLSAACIESYKYF